MSGSDKKKLPPHPLLRADALSKVYVRRGGPFAKRQFTYALNAVSFYVRHGETLGLVGESGSGKSTLARILARIDVPTSGRIHLDGEDVTGLSRARLFPYRAKVQMVFQDPFTSLNPRMTIRDIVGEGLIIHRRAKGDELTRKVTDRLAEVRLEADVLNRYPHEFSGGERQRIALARALALDPLLLVADEPVSALDVSVQAQVVNLIETVQESRKLAVLFISHDLSVVEHTAHRIAVIYRGRIVEIGPVADVAASRLHPYTERLFEVARGRSVSSGRPPPFKTDRAPGAQPKGCVYYSECPRAKHGICDDEAPPLELPNPERSHRVACFFPNTSSQVATEKRRLPVLEVDES